MIDKANCHSKTPNVDDNTIPCLYRRRIDIILLVNYRNNYIHFKCDKYLYQK